MLKTKKLSSILFVSKEDRFYTFLNYKNTDFLKKFINSGGKIFPKFITKLSAKEQRNIAKSIKISRITGLLKFINN
jgi:ribosomal protein S18